MARRRRKKYGFSFSWRRAVGISKRKGQISRAIGIPLTRQGRERKVGGCILGLFGLGGRKRRRRKKTSARHVR